MAYQAKRWNHSIKSKKNPAQTSSKHRKHLFLNKLRLFQYTIIFTKDFIIDKENQWMLKKISPFENISKNFSRFYWLSEDFQESMI